MTKEITEDWEQFNPRDYLQEYYVDISPENYALLQFAVKSFRRIPSNGVLLDFGGGPTIYPLISAAKDAKEIHFCDYLDANLSEVEKWLQNHDSAFDWQKFVKTILQLEHQHNDIPHAFIGEREAKIRESVTRVFNCDVRSVPPIDKPMHYDAVVSNFCVESVAETLTHWRELFRNLISLLKPDGFLLLSAVKGATCYAVKDKLFPAHSLTESDLMEALIEEGFDPESIILESIPADSTSEYEGIMMALAKKRPN